MRKISFIFFSVFEPMKNTWKNVASIDDKQTRILKANKTDFPFYFLWHCMVDLLFTEVYTVETSSTVSSLIHNHTHLQHPPPCFPSVPLRSIKKGFKIWSSKKF